MLFERRMVYETWELLEKIPANIAMHWVWGGESGRSGSQAIQAQTSFRRAQNSTNDFHPSLGHMVSATLAIPHGVSLITYSFDLQLPQQAPGVLGKSSHHRNASIELTCPPAFDIFRFLVSNYLDRKSRL